MFPQLQLVQSYLNVPIQTTPAPIPLRYAAPGIAAHPTKRTAGLVRRLANRVIAGRRRRRVIRELSALDDRLLRDIGITRWQIPQVADAGKIEAPVAPVVSRPVRVTSVVSYEPRSAANDNREEAAA